MAEEKTYTAEEVKAMVAEIMEGQNAAAKDHRQKLENLEKTIGPMGSWLRCFSCGILSDKPRYKEVEEEKARLEYHSSDLWREMYAQGKYHCQPCHKAVHMREGKEIKRRIKAGEMEDPALKPIAGANPVVGGLNRVETEE
jgi:hypothetical protein